MTRRRPKRSQHRTEVVQRRKRTAGEQRAHAQALEVAAAERRHIELHRELRRYTRRRWLGWGLVVASVAMFFVHFLGHTETLHLFSMSLQDLLIGYPTAGLLLVIAVFCLGQLHPAESKR